MESWKYFVYKYA